MTLPDLTAGAALSARVIKPVFFAWLDIDGDPVWANSAGKNITPTGTGDPDLDDIEFTGISHLFTDISDVRVSRGGSQSVTARLSGLQSVDGELLEAVGDRANWQGRQARLWRVIRDASNIQQGGYQPYYTGYMTALNIGGEDDGSQFVQVTIETYLAAFSAASNRTYLEQERYDSGDLSAKAAIAIANGISGNPIVNNVGTGGQNGNGGGLRSPWSLR